ncbi:MAG: nickel pincer cofactor biosynthesis protein LarC [Acidimicrobiales bacterium]|nr:nickel pincer cofactor biosynthesis protein LarC [Acidimicrobiales bacterium]RZV48000.1 MAG: nickel pincer cofactor biosynthesis protein LarC [Acidimicrobiales bacterium]
MTTLWVHPFNGIAGDMFLGALIDAGADVDEIRSTLTTLEVPEWELRTEETARNAIAAVNVHVDTTEGHTHRTAADIIDIVTKAPLPPRVASRAIAVFETLAAAEGAVHNMLPSDVHFHEVGGVDAIVDVVGVCVALELLGVDELVLAPIAVGHGTTNSAHGRIPHPAPATIRLLEGWPVAGIDINLELTTPTGAALVTALATSAGPMPAMTVTASGFGAGDAEPETIPNLLHVVLGDRPEMQEDTLAVLETNVDDLSGELVAHAVSSLVLAGALDAWATPIQMKKHRPAQTVSVLCELGDSERLGQQLLRETGSLGFRSSTVLRTSVSRSMGAVDVDGHQIRIKASPARIKAEMDDVVSVALATGRTAREIATEAERVWAEQNPTDVT